MEDEDKELEGKGWKDGNELYSRKPSIKAIKEVIEYHSINEIPFINKFLASIDYLTKIDGMSILKYALKVSNFKFAFEMVKQGFKLDKKEIEPEQDIVKDFDLKKAKEVLIKHKNIVSRMRGDASLTENDIRRMVVISNLPEEIRDKWLTSKASPLHIAMETGQFELVKKIIESGGTLKKSELEAHDVHNKRSVIDRMLGRNVDKVNVALVAALDKRIAKNPEIERERVLQKGKSTLYKINHLDLLDNLSEPEKLNLLKDQDLDILYRITVTHTLFNGIQHPDPKSTTKLNEKIENSNIKPISREEMILDIKYILNDLKAYTESRGGKFDLNSYIKLAKASMASEASVHYEEAIKMLKEPVSEEITNLDKQIKHAADSLMIKEIAYDVTQKILLEGGSNLVVLYQQSNSSAVRESIENDILSQLEKHRKAVIKESSIDDLKDKMINQIKQGDIIDIVKKSLPQEVDPLGITSSLKDRAIKRIKLGAFR